MGASADPGCVHALWLEGAGGWSGEALVFGSECCGVRVFMPFYLEHVYLQNMLLCCNNDMLQHLRGPQALGCKTVHA